MSNLLPKRVVLGLYNGTDDGGQRFLFIRIFIHLRLGVYLISNVANLKVILPKLNKMNIGTDLWKKHKTKKFWLRYTFLLLVATSAQTLEKYTNL